MTAAKKSDWQTKPLPVARSVINVQRPFSIDDMKVLKRGVIPEQMEDKWFVFWSRGKLFFHRSWTGYCVYVLEFKSARSVFQATRLLVNRDPEQYCETNDENDEAMIWFLVDVVLLHRSHPFPSTVPSEGERVLAQWGQVGRAALGQHPQSDDDG